MRTLTLIGLALGATLAIGCGDNGTHEQTDGGLPDVEAQTDVLDNSKDAPAGCGFAAVYDTVGFVSTDVGTNSTFDPTQYIYFDGVLKSGTTPDLLEIELMNGYGAFVDGIKPGTFEIAGDEANYGTCGLCLRLMSQVDPASWEASQYYMAVSGTVTLASVEGELKGTLTNVLFQHVTIDMTDLTSTPAGDNCTARAVTADFEAEMERPDGGWPMEDNDGGMPDGMHM